jgi:dipeptidyl aminopeptidase/acylaminoacyl peptidase
LRRHGDRLTASTFRQMKNVTEANPQQAQSVGTNGLIQYRNVDSVELDIALYTPGSFDPSKKYPILIDIYARLSQKLQARGERQKK